MDRPPSAPPVVAVIVANEPGPWFEEALACFGNQDYPNLSVLVVDGNGSADSPRRVASVLPDAYVRRVDGGSSFAALANDALQTVQGASFLAFCHDDVAPDPDAIRRMVEEAFRSNAAVVAPKVVEWERPERLEDVGLVVDKTGTTAPIVERGELDQEQHDAVRDVFAVTNTFMLVRSDLFSALGGFDSRMGNCGVDIDFCWRAQVAGGRVLVAPAARVRHKQGGPEADPPDAEHLNLDRRHHLRAMLKSYSFLHLVRVVPQAALVTLIEMLVALVSRRWREARGLPEAWWWNLRQAGELRSLRRQVQKARAVPDSDIRRLQVRGSVRLTTYLRRRLHAEDKAEAFVRAGHRLAGALGSRPGQMATAVLAVLVLAILFGSRHLFDGRLPAVGEFAPFPRMTTLLSHYLSGWRFTGLGSSAPAPTAFGLLGLTGIAFLGKMALLQKVLVLGAWPVAALGISRLSRRFESTLARLVAIIAYLAVPLPYDSLARGRWSGLLAWAALPWLFAIVARITGLSPFSPHGDEAGALPATRLRTELLKLGLLVALVATLVPSIALVLIVGALGLVLGSLFSGGTTGALRGLGGAVVAAVMAVVLHVPWSIDVFGNGGWATVTGVAPDPAQAPSLASLLRFDIGPMGNAPLGWAFVVAAALPLVIGRSWRLAWAVRCWTVALTCVLVAWAGGRGWLPLRLETPDVLLAPAAVGLAMAAALGAAAFDLDLPGYRFGWRQLASIGAGAALVAGVLPVIGAIGNGQWSLTNEDVARSVDWMSPEARNGAFRVLWLGAPEALPLDGWRLGDGVAYATSRDGAPSFTDLLPGSASTATQAIAVSLELAERGDTARLGRLLAPMGVRYIVVPVELETGRTDVGTYPVPVEISRALVSQVDLRLLPSDPGVAVYENTSWGPGRAVLPARLTGPIPEQLGAGVDLAGATPVLADGGPTRYEGSIPGDGAVFLAEAPSSRWRLTVGGNGASRQSAYGVANAYRTGGAGIATLRFRTPIIRYGFILLQVLLWLVAIRAVVGLRRRAVAVETLDSGAVRHERVEAAWPEPAAR
jgi:GT2 family glycosyltransferase